MSETRQVDTPPANRPQTSLRARIRLWTVAVSTVALALFTAAGVLEERRQLLDAESAHAAALLEHLARMPEFQKRAADAKSFLNVLRGSLRPVGGSLDLVAPNASAWLDGPVLARLAKLKLDFIMT